MPNAEEYATPAAHTKSAVDKIYLVGAGIASMAAAAFLIRDGDIRGQDITIFEESGIIGGSLDGAGSPAAGYSLRGGRMLESKYLCTFDLFSSIPTLDESRTVTQEIFAWNETLQTSSKSRLFRAGNREVAPPFGLRESHILTIERMALEPEFMLGRTTIAEQFDAAFFATNFWLMWCTTFAFQPWHSAVEFKRYLVRFAHMVAGFNRLHGIMRTVYNQYDSMVRPLHKWLSDRDVQFVRDTRVTDLKFAEVPAGRLLCEITVSRHGETRKIPVRETDRIFITLGSMTEGSSLGSMETAPRLNGTDTGGAWTLWQNIAAGRGDFGHPEVFDGHIDKSKWVSFTVTLHDTTLLRLVGALTGNVPGEGGLITFPDSAWLASIVIPHQPHFIGQPEDVSVFWGYGLFVDKPGDFVGKPMSACSGREIMTEILGHLCIGDEAEAILNTSVCIPCMMPFITSQFMPRQQGDRPQIVPHGALNFAFIGQFCEQPDDVVFTVEYSIRAAQTAVYTLLGLGRKPKPVYQGKFDPRVLFKAFMALHEFTG